MNRYFVIFIFLLLTVSCGIETKLDTTDLTWLIFKQGDTLIYSSSDNKLDTTFILKKEIIYPEYNLEVHGKYHPQIGQIWYFNKNVQYIYDGKEMVYLKKESPDKKADGFISYYNSTFFFDTDYFEEIKDTFSINGNDLHDLIKITSSYKINLSCDNLQTLWWSKKYGLIKYETCNGQIWTRIK